MKNQTLDHKKRGLSTSTSDRALILSILNQVVYDSFDKFMIFFKTSYMMFDRIAFRSAIPITFSLRDEIGVVYANSRKTIFFERKIKFWIGNKRVFKK